ncbi:unnamed protein product, partial [Closterium sp. NIES-64]
MLISRAPARLGAGRVNLIGEHIDYEGYAVLPMAIHLDTLVAISCARTPSMETSACKDDSPFPPRLRVANMDPAKYKGVWDHVHETGGREEPTLGLDVLVDGCVPLGSGLSSSAALVCSSAIAVMAALGFSFPKAEIADLACRCERYIGTQSGGMDQVTTTGSGEGCAARPAVVRVCSTTGSGEGCAARRAVVRGAARRAVVRVCSTTGSGEGCAARRAVVRGGQHDRQ